MVVSAYTVLRLGALGLIVALAGCTNFAMPASGPESWDVKSGKNS